VRERGEVSIQRSHEAHRASRAAQRAAVAITLVHRAGIALRSTDVLDTVRIDVALTSVG
jgi:hypothetical protein